jgi:N-acetylglucosamine kinase-like BadF-type ATPase
VGRGAKGDVAALARMVIDAAGEGDAAALAVVDEAAAGLAEHAEALWAQLGPWSGAVPVVFHGGVLSSPLVAGAVRARLEASPHALVVRPAAADAVEGALRFARGLVPA